MRRIVIAAMLVGLIIGVSSARLVQASDESADIEDQYYRHYRYLGAFVVRHGKNILGPPVFTPILSILDKITCGWIKEDDIPHVGLYLGNELTYDLRIVNGRGVIFATTPYDVDERNSFKGRFKNAGWFSVVESRKIKVQYQGRIMRMCELPTQVKIAIIKRVVELAKKDLPSPALETTRDGLTARAGRDYGEYNFATANCGHPIVRFYDQALKELDIKVTTEVYASTRPEAFSNQTTGLTRRERVQLGLEKVILKETTLEDLFKSFGILDPSLANDLLFRLKPPEWSLNPSDVRSVESKDEKGDPIAAVEAGPVIAKMLTPALLAQAWRQQRTGINMDDLLPRSGPPETKLLGPISIPQALTQGNAIAARAVEFRTDSEDLNTAKAVVMVIKTKIDKGAEYKAYQHDAGICPRYHWDTLDILGAIPVSLTDTGNQDSDSPWFWFYRLYNHRLKTFEEACQFAALVSESCREIVIDSRWLGQQYSPHWNNPQKQYDYILNFQLWSYSSDEILKLLRTILSKIDQLGGSWKVTFANQQEPIQPTIYIEEAWYTGSNVYVSVWSCLPFPTMACFHGTKQYQRGGRDVFFEEWKAVYPGRNVLQLRLGQIDNAVIYCEVDGFIDKVFVSVDKMRPAPSLPDLEPPVLEQKVGASPEITILWPPAEATVPVLRDQLDMPGLLDKGGLVAIHGTYANAPPGSKITVYVYTDQYYEQKQPVVMANGLWGTRIYLAGEGEFNKHWIYARLSDATGRELAKAEVGPVYRREGVGTEPPAGAGISLKEPSEGDLGGDLAPRKIVLEGRNFQSGRGVYRWKDGTITIGGGPDGPYSSGGSAWWRVELPADASLFKIRMEIWHGLPSQLGKGLHATRPGGNLKVYLNDVLVHTIVCQHRHLFGDYWPEESPELGRQLPEIDLKSKGISGKSLTIQFVVAPYTCMDVRSVSILIFPQSKGLGANEDHIPNWESVENLAPESRIPSSIGDTSEKDALPSTLGSPPSVKFRNLPGNFRRKGKR